MKNQRLDIEKIIIDIYQDKFKDEEHLHSLLEKNAKEIYDFVQEGITNLGVYLGGYNVGDVNIIPILIGEFIFKIPENKINQTLEERLTRILRGCYSPRFNNDPENTIQEIEQIIVNSEDSKKNLYQKLHDHYKEVLELAEEIN